MIAYFRFHHLCEHDPLINRREAERPETRTFPDYHPITEEQVAELLRNTQRIKGLERESFQEESGSEIVVAATLSSILARLKQGIEGMTCPSPGSGPISRKSYELADFFVKNIQEKDLKGEGDDPKLVKRLYQLITGGRG